MSPVDDDHALSRDSGLRVCVFCGSNAGERPGYARAARQLGSLLARRGIGVVYGGGRAGLMGTLADAVLTEGGEVLGVIPKSLMDRDLGHISLTELRVVPGMHERKALMAHLSDAFIALPGGLGTLEELFEVWAWGQLGLHHKPIGLLNVDSYFRPLVAFIGNAVRQGFLRPEDARLLRVAKDPMSLVDNLLPTLRSLSIGA